VPICQWARDCQASANTISRWLKQAKNEPVQSKQERAVEIQRLVRASQKLGDKVANLENESAALRNAAPNPQWRAGACQIMKAKQAEFR